MRQRSSLRHSVAGVGTYSCRLVLGCGEEATYGPARVSFPEDEGAHPESGMEWWYLNATVSDNLGHEYTAMLAYFNKKSPRPPLKIISIADLDAEVFYHEVPSIYDLVAAQPVYAEEKLDLRWDDYDRWYRTDDDSYHYSLQAKGDTIGFTFDLSQDKEPLMVGGDGLIDWTEGSTYYYSLTRLQVTGQIEIEGRDHRRDRHRLDGPPVDGHHRRERLAVVLHSTRRPDRHHLLEHLRS